MDHVSIRIVGEPLGLAVPYHAHELVFVARILKIDYRKIMSYLHGTLKNHITSRTIGKQRGLP